MNRIAQVLAEEYHAELRSAMLFLGQAARNAVENRFDDKSSGWLVNATEQLHDTYHDWLIFDLRPYEMTRPEMLLYVRAVESQMALFVGKDAVIKHAARMMNEACHEYARSKP